MRSKITVTTSWAVGAFLLTIALAWPVMLEADDAGDKPVTTAAKRSINGVEITLRTANGAALKAGDQPVLTLEAVNTTDKQAHVEAWASMYATAPASPMSRMPAFPESIWQDHCPLTLGPGERRTSVLHTGTKLPAGKEFALSIQTDERRASIGHIKASTADQRPSNPS